MSQTGKQKAIETEKRFPMHSKEYLSRLNHFSRVKYLELKYGYYCKQLADDNISREFFDKRVREITTLLSDYDFLESGDFQNYSYYTRDDLKAITEEWKARGKEHATE